MEAPPLFKMPGRPQQPLQMLSPERLNAPRPVSAASVSSKTSKTSDSDHVMPQRGQPSSAHSSPTRRANLFADYHPVTTQQQESIVLGGGLPQSPSMPDFRSARGHTRTNSDVQGLVKRFEHLDVKDRDAEYSERRKKHEAELRRAQVAREEAESDVKRLREEVRRLKREGEEARDRERKLARRVEVVMEENVSAKEQHSSQHAVYDKELRKCRKEAYKSSSAVIKLQEELKATRQSLRITQSGLEVEKQKVQHREQDTFSAQYQLAAVQEEMDKLRAHLKIVEDEKEAIKQNLKDEEVARIAAEGKIALPVSQEDDEDLLSSPGKRSPKKRSPSPWSDDKENLGVAPKKFGELKRLQEELHWEQMRREHAEEMVDFLGMECKFRCCSCQSHSKQRQDHDLAIPGELASRLERIMEGMRVVLTPPGDLTTVDEMQLDAPEIKAEPLELEHAEASERDGCADGQPGAQIEADAPILETEAVVNDDLSMTMMAEDVPEQHAELPQQTVEEGTPTAPRPTPVQELEQAPAEMVTTIPIQSSSPHTPTQTHEAATPQHSVRTVTTTTTIPMQFTPVAKHQMLLHHEDTENVNPTSSTGNELQRVRSGPPEGFDRAAALAAIEYRRGRAKSIAAGQATPRKQMLEGVGLKERRDISAPALGQQGKNKGLLGKGAGCASIGRATGKSVRGV
ncbi:hypothetical protein Tdes44962_MAKER03500 [Teratosphaeria destructans]|uniref:Uncharacterized protein n=1 Tax=Teratosphaeria destructans TaxID=418781 RepID=A0A9W7SPS1_9PEZI|nr:hypothetical protein Tdes44962_MAKER03500 [Teratosphaeria destructans]